jgi:hypothetical protein
VFFIVIGALQRELEDVGLLNVAERRDCGVARLGVLEIEDVRKLNLLPMFSVVAGISMSEVLVKTQALDILTKSIFNWIGPLFTPPFPWSCVPEP